MKKTLGIVAIITTIVVVVGIMVAGIIALLCDDDTYDFECE